MLKKIKKYIRRLLERFRLYYESYRDANRYFSSASWAGPTDQHRAAHIEADLIKHYHVIEKGLAMPDFRPEFGKPVVRRLEELIVVWEDQIGDGDNCQYMAAQETMRAYFEKHDLIGIDVSDVVPSKYRENKISGSQIAAGVKPAHFTYSKEECHSFNEFIKSRHSVRSFRMDCIPSAVEIRSAISVATSTPSVCNRQTWRVHVYEGDKAQVVLNQQNGNRGFGHQVPLALVITTDMRCFAEVIERYQPWIEGGLFSMNLMLALHARGIANVALNWSRKTAADISLRRVADIPNYERIIMVLACGYAEDDALTPESCRHEVARFVRWHD